MDNRNNKSEQNSQQSVSAVTNDKVGEAGSGKQNDPANRMQDGTNDFKNGDQEPSSEASSTQ